jgi:hypothetical protein
MMWQTPLLGAFGLPARVLGLAACGRGGGATGQMKLSVGHAPVDQADKTVTFSPVKTAISVTANMTTTVNIPVSDQP